MTGTRCGDSPCAPGYRWVPALVLLAALIGAGSAAAQGADCTGFSETEITSGGTNGATAVFADDLDGDGDVDLLSASHNDDKIAWYENDGSTPPEFTQRIISDRALGVESVFAADVDGDGDIDVLSAAPFNDTISWYENIGTQPPAFFERVVSRSADHAQSVFAADVDGDGDLDILSASFIDDKIAWYENPLIDADSDGGTDFITHVISTDAEGAASVFAADMDGDGDIDVLSASIVDDKIAWYEAEQGVEINEDDEEVPVLLFTEHVISSAADGALSIFAADLDDDGDQDVLSASLEDDKIAWYENLGVDLDSSGSIDFVEREITTGADGAKSVLAADVDNDGDLDVLSASENDDTIAWYGNDGADPPAFVEHIVSSGVDSADAVFAADIDGDGDTDLLTASSAPGPFSQVDRVAWYESDDAPVPAWTQHLVADTAEGANALSAADMDSDGDLDLVSASDGDRIAWYEIEGTAAPVFTRHSVSTTAAGASAVIASDLDGDGDQDIVAAAADDDTVSWFASDGADPPVFTERTITTSADSVQAVFVADVNSDGLLDVLSASFADDKIAWYESDGGTPPSFVERIIASADPALADFRAEGARSVFAIDVDDDGDVDVLSASSLDGKIAWYENLFVDADSDGAIDFDERILASDDTTESEFRAAGASWVTAADLDSDGDVDVLSASSGDSRIAWYEQDVDSDGGGTIVFTQRLISTSSFIAVFVSTADLDGDDDLDVLAGSVGDDEVAWYENDGASPPLFKKHEVATRGANPAAIVAGDLTGDQRPDLVVGFRFGLAWYEQIGEICDGFDANGDGVMDGNELAWVTRAFGQGSPAPHLEWWFVVDFNQDGIVDGDDLAILASRGVWGETTDSCVYSCR